MSKKAKALSFEQSKNLLPGEFCPNVLLTGRKKLIQTPMGVVAFRHSSLLDCGEWKTSYNEDDIRTEIDYLLYALGYEGVLILPRDVMLGFKDKNYNGRWANNGYPIHIFKENDRFYWHGIDGNTLDVTKYFISNKPE